MKVQLPIDLALTSVISLHVQTRVWAFQKFEAPFWGFLG